MCIYTYTHTREATDELISVAMIHITSKEATKSAEKEVTKEAEKEVTKGAQKGTQNLTQK